MLFINFLLLLITVFASKASVFPVTFFHGANCVAKESLFHVVRGYIGLILNSFLKKGSFVVWQGAGCYVDFKFVCE